MTDVLRPRINTSEACSSCTGCGDDGMRVGARVGDSLGPGELDGCVDSPGVGVGETDAAADGEADGASLGCAFELGRAACQLLHVSSAAAPAASTSTRNRKSAPDPIRRFAALVE